MGCILHLYFAAVGDFVVFNQHPLDVPPIPNVLLVLFYKLVEHADSRMKNKTASISGMAGHFNCIILCMLTTKCKLYSHLQNIRGRYTTMLLHRIPAGKGAH